MENLWHENYESNRSLRRRFWSRVEKSTEDDCWLWRGSLNKGGYGYLHVSRRVFLNAHRISWKLHYGYIPKGMYVLHKCDNPPCVNPKHLWLGTNSDNIKDSIRKGRFRKLTEDEILWMKKLAKSSFLTQKIITKLFNISSNLINGIALDKDWDYSNIL